MARKRFKTPFADLLPPLSTEEREALRADIKAQGGVQVTVLIDEADNVLDGHNRLEIDPQAPTRVVKGLPEDEKPAFVYRQNFHRRNLSRAQKDDVLRKMKADAKRLQEKDPKRYTQKRLAGLYGVAQQTVSDWFMQNTGTGNVHKPRRDARTVLSEDGKAKAIERCQAGETQAQVAVNLSVHQATISRTVNADKKKKEAQKKRRVAAKQAVGLGELGIIEGDYRKLGSQVPDGSVDLIFTDPPYDKQTLPQYKDLGVFAGRVLKPGGSLVTYLNDSSLPEVLDLVRKTGSLKFWWPLACVHTGATTNMKQWGVIVQHKLMLWFVKGNARADKGFVNSLVMSERDKEHHDWGQGLPEARYYIQKLVPRDGLVVDPYCGGGTTCVAAVLSGRRYLAFEKDHKTALIARKRIADTDRS